MQFDWERDETGRLYSTDTAESRPDIEKLTQEQEEELNEVEHGSEAGENAGAVLNLSGADKATAVQYIEEDAWGTIQGKFKAGKSGPKSIKGTTATRVSYTRDTDGYFDFGAPTDDLDKTWQDPRHGAKVDLRNGVKQNPVVGTLPLGLTKGKQIVTIDKKNRPQHFSIADRIVNGRQANHTWHHLKNRYEMVQVYTPYHKSFGHNGGVHLW